MNEAEKKKAEFVEEARLESGAVREDAIQKYTLRSARLAIQRKEAAILKRKEKITRLELDNQEDHEAIRQLETICTQIQAQEVMQKINEINANGATVETEHINRALEFLSLVGDAFESLTVQQMAKAVQGAVGQASEIAVDAQEVYEKTISRPMPEDSEGAE